MRILSIETSCDETAVSVLQADGDLHTPTFSVLGNTLNSQIDLHVPYGGVYPTLAKREHGKNLTPLLEKSLSDAGLLSMSPSPISEEKKEVIRSILAKEDGLGDRAIAFLETHTKPDIDMIAVTAGPGLEPALWVGISFAQALGVAWDVPVVPTNHMKGHIASVLLGQTDTAVDTTVAFPAVALLISGGHTEIVLIERWGSYRILGQTRDDAVGEAFDKVARMLGLPYPGGPQISLLAQHAREENLPQTITLPRPMIHSADMDFSFSGLKTSVLYTLRDLPTETVLSEDLKKQIAREFEDAVTDVLLSKTERALMESGARTLIIAGGVTANTHIRQTFTHMITAKFSDVTLRIPERTLSTDNAVMIGMAGYIEVLLHPELLKNTSTTMRAKGNLTLQ